MWGLERVELIQSRGFVPRRQPHNRSVIGGLERIAFFPSSLFYISKRRRRRRRSSVSNMCGIIVTLSICFCPQLLHRTGITPLSPGGGGGTWWWKYIQSLPFLSSCYQCRMWDGFFHRPTPSRVLRWWRWWSYKSLDAAPYFIFYSSSFCCCCLAAAAAYTICQRGFSAPVTTPTDPLWAPRASKKESEWERANCCYALVFGVRRLCYLPPPLVFFWMLLLLSPSLIFFFFFFFVYTFRYRLHRGLI